MPEKYQHGQPIELFMDRALAVLTEHVGRPNAISAMALYKAIYDREPDDAITATRCLRTVIQRLREQGRKVCSATASVGGGYYLASTRGELKEFCDKFHRRALTTLAQEARMKRIALPELLGQLSLQYWKEMVQEGKPDGA